jgi:hypothetical protein
MDMITDTWNAKSLYRAGTLITENHQIQPGVVTGLETDF